MSTVHAPVRSFTQNLWTWIPVGGLQVHASLLVDPLSMTMVLFVTGVSSLIHLYSIGYMKGDRDYPKFFVYLNLFVASMLILVLDLIAGEVEIATAGHPTNRAQKSSISAEPTGCVPARVLSSVQE